MSPRKTATPQTPELPREQLNGQDSQEQMSYATATQSEDMSKTRIRPGHEESESQKQRSWFNIIMGLAFLAAVVLWILGQIQQGKFSVTWRRVFDSGPELEFVDAREGVVLFTKNEQDRCEVIAQLSDQSGWVILSRNDYTARRPVLSLSGTQVAYFSQLEEPHIAVVSLITDTLRTVTATVFDTSLSSRQLTGLVVCDWSSVAWTPDENHLSFFICAPGSDVSYVAVAALDGAQPRIVWIEDEPFVGGERSVIWLDSGHLLIAQPSLSGTYIETVPIIFEVSQE